MLKKLTRSFLLLLIVMVVGTLAMIPVQAATTDFTADGNVAISSVIHGAITTDLLIMNGSKAEGWNFDSGNFTVTSPDSTAGFKVGSGSMTAKSIRVKSQNQNSEVVCADNTTAGTSYVTLPTTADVYTVYPSDTSCEGGGNNGSSGGSSKNKKPKTPAVPATPAVPGVSAAIPATPASSALANASPNAAFNRMLTIGSTGEDVRALQNRLKAEGFFKTEATGYFGPITRESVKAYQTNHGIDPLGMVGPMTRAELNKATVLVPASSNDQSIQSLLNQIKILQEQLAKLRGGASN
jgi:hypothetical protein